MDFTHVWPGRLEHTERAHAKCFLLLCGYGVTMLVLTKDTCKEKKRNNTCSVRQMPGDTSMSESQAPCKGSCCHQVGQLFCLCLQLVWSGQPRYFSSQINCSGGWIAGTHNFSNEGTICSLCLLGWILVTERSESSEQMKIHLYQLQNYHNGSTTHTTVWWGRKKDWPQWEIVWAASQAQTLGSGPRIHIGSTQGSMKSRWSVLSFQILRKLGGGGGGEDCESNILRGRKMWESNWRTLCTYDQ